MELKTVQLRRKPHGTAFRLKAAHFWLMPSSISKLPGSLTLRPERRSRTSSTIARTALSLSPSPTVSLTYPLPRPLSPYQSSTNPLCPAGRGSGQILINIKTLTLGKIEGKRRWWRQRMRWLDGITDSIDMSLGKLREAVRHREAWRPAAHGVSKSQLWLRLNSNNERRKVEYLLTQTSGCLGGSFYSQNLCF